MTANEQRPDPLTKLQRSIKKRVYRLFGWKQLEDARTYVGTTEASGQLQFELLRREGMQPGSRVLEIGCGVLHAGVPLMKFLDKGHYAGIDPNEWLRQKRMEDPEIRRLVEDKHGRFLSRDDFDASSLGVQFDYVLSHSVLSHAAHHQLEQFLRNCAKVLAAGGRIVASIRLAEGNAYGSPGTPDGRDSNFAEWQYPGVSFFRMSTILETADALGLKAVHKPEYTEFYTAVQAHEYHDWFVYSWK